jgi:hypothetical protein
VNTYNSSYIPPLHPPPTGYMSKNGPSIVKNTIHITSSRCRTIPKATVSTELPNLVRSSPGLNQFTHLALIKIELNFEVSYDPTSTLT